MTRLKQCDSFFQMFQIFHSVTHFPKCDPFFTAWPVLSSLTHFSKCYKFFTVWPTFPNMTHFFKCDKFFTVVQHMGILFAHARDEWNNLSSAPFVWTRTRCVGFLNGWSTLRERSCQERWKIITSLHTFLTLWIFTVFVGTLDEDILMIKVRT